MSFFPQDKPYFQQNFISKPPHQANQGLPLIWPWRTACYLLANFVFWLLQLCIYHLIFSVIFSSYCLSNVFVPCLPSLFLFSPFSLLQSPFTSPFPFFIMHVLLTFLPSFSSFNYFLLSSFFLSQFLFLFHIYLTGQRKHKIKGNSPFFP